MRELTDRQHQIVDHAIEMIGEGGLSGLTMRRLSERLGVTEPALYRHFENKTAMLAATDPELPMRAGTPQGSAEAGRVADAGHGTAPGPARFMVLVQKRLRSLYGAILIAKAALSVVMVVTAIIRAGKLRRLGA
ncbi:MAG: TetR family transcriptional regulator [bacterium]